MAMQATAVTRTAEQAHADRIFLTAQLFNVSGLIGTFARCFPGQCTEELDQLRNIITTLRAVNNGTQVAKQEAADV